MYCLAQYLGLHTSLVVPRTSLTNMENGNSTFAPGMTSAQVPTEATLTPLLVKPDIDMAGERSEVFA